MPTDRADAWTRLGQLLVERRIDLNPRYKNRRTFCEERGVDYKVVSDIETTKRTNFGRDTIAHLEVGYEVKAGGIQAVLDGATTLPPRESQNPFEGVDNVEEALRNLPGLADEHRQIMMQTLRAFLDKP